MTNSIAIIPTVSPADIAQARAYAIANGNNVGTKGRVPRWAINEWINALRPTVIKPAERKADGRGKHTGKRGGVSTVNVDGTMTVVSKTMASNARAYAKETGIDIPTRGRTPISVIQEWINAGMPEYREEVATVYYRALDKRGRLNGKERIAIVYRDMLPSGKPAMHTYWDVLGISGVPTRITTNAMLIDVTRNEDDTLSYAWVSKSDNADIVGMLKGNVSLHM